MLNAIKEAKLCKTDVPIGCVIKIEERVIASAHNMREEYNDVTAHAELIALRAAEKKLNTSRLSDCTLYVTLEPCPMCAWAILQSGIKTVYFGAYNQQYGALISHPIYGAPKIKIYGGIEEQLCNKMLEEFFDIIRKKNDN